MATLTFNYGTMGSGMTSHLLILSHNLDEKKVPFIAIKPSTDTRTSVITSKLIKDEIRAININEDDDIYEAIYYIVNSSELNFLYILVDDAQFLSKKQVEELAQIVDDLSINVVCFGLRTDFQTKLFEGSQRLFEIADELHEFSTICECGNRATMNARIDIHGNIIREGSQILIGDENYISVCRRCYRENRRNYEFELEAIRELNKVE
jgi:thymidine kinase